MAPPDALCLAVIPLSESFSGVWGGLSEELEISVHTLSVPPVIPPAAVAVVVAAGGEEERSLDLVPSLAGNGGRPPVFVVGALPSHRFAAEAVRRGAADYFVLPEDLGLLGRTLGARVQAARQRARRSGETRSPAAAFHELLGESDALRHTLELARRVLRHGEVTVLITGETGTGKELLARALHTGGSRGDGPFVAVNCAAIPANLLESELFGHERGAFTDAHQSKPGLFEEADRGTMFLDEVGHLPLLLQGKLLRVLDEKRIRRVGATQSREVDARVIAATNVDLAAAVKRGEFREDLYYRLNVVALELPPLRERGDDVDLLAQTFIEALSGRYGLAPPRLNAATRTALRSHSWPGNVRELRHAIERALLLSEPGTLDPAQLAPRPQSSGAPGSGQFTGSMEQIILAAAQEAVAACGGNRTMAARRLGISRQRLHRILGKTDDGRD